MSDPAQQQYHLHGKLQFRMSFNVSVNDGQLIDTIDSIPDDVKCKLSIVVGGFTATQ